MEGVLQLLVGEIAGHRHGGDDNGGGGDTGGGGDNDGRIPNDPRRMRYEGPWLQQQLILSCTLGIIAFVAFSLLRRRSPALFAPRTKLKGFTAHAKGIDDGAFSWIMPTFKAKEIKILHIVGLDAAVLLTFFKMGFWTLLYLSIWSCVVLMPVNYWDHGSIDGVAPNEEPDPDDPGKASGGFLTLLPGPGPELPWTFRMSLPSAYHLTHLVSTYLFSILIMRALYKGLGRFVRARQLYALDLLQSIPARTVEMRELPDHLQREKDLAEYFEKMGLAVESTVIVREVRGLKTILAQRAQALFKLERAWCNWLGNPTKAGNYDPEHVIQVSEERAHILAQGGERLVFALAQDEHGGERARFIERADAIPDPADGIEMPKNEKRPKMRLSQWNPLSPRVDALTLLETRFRALDATVQRMRKKGSPPTNVGFVTFVDGISAQIAAQAVHYPLPGFCHTTLAPEPRDIIWANISIPLNERRVRQVIVLTFTTALFLFYIPPLTFLASLLSPKVIQKYLPGLFDLIAKSERLKAFVETSLPSVAVISFNALLPLILEWAAYLEGIKARSLVEFSVLKRYYIFLLTSVIFIFLIATTALGVIADLADNPMRIIDKLAQSLPRARQFSLSYVVFQALAVMPLQLLQLPVIFARSIGRLFAETPRDYAELNAPPQLYAGSVYPAALIVFTLCILYSIVMPLITVFGTIYFALAYLVYKYKLLYVFYRSYESRGQAWPLCSTRIIWALGLFQFFQLSLFSVRKQFLLSTLMLPLFVLTIWFGVHLSRTFSQLSEYVSLSSIAEINRPIISQAEPNSSQLVQPVDSENAPSAHVANKAADRKSSRSGSKTANPIVAMRDAALDLLEPEEAILSRKRYAANDETLFVAQQDRHTDYREPPAGGYYFGVLNTGRRRYGHPALTGTLPEFWPPVREEEDDKEATGTPTPASQGRPGAPGQGTTSGVGSTNSAPTRSRKMSRPGEALVLSLRHRKQSLSSSQDTTKPRARRASQRNAQHARDRTASRIARNEGDHRDAAANTSKIGTLIPTGDDDEDCDIPEHYHESPADVWGRSSGQGGTSARASTTAKQPSHDDETGDAYIRPVHAHRERDGWAQGSTDESQDELHHDDDGLNRRADGERDNDDDDDNDNDEDDDDDEDELTGIYVHRTARSVQLSGSLRGSQ